MFYRLCLKIFNYIKSFLTVLCCSSVSNVCLLSLLHSFGRVGVHLFCCFMGVSVVTRESIPDNTIQQFRVETSCSPFAIMSPIMVWLFLELWYTGEQQYTVKNFTYFNFLDTICIIHFTRQMIQFYVSHCCKRNLHVTPLQTNDLI